MREPQGNIDRAQRARDRAFIALLALLAVIAALVVWPRSGDAGAEPVQWTAPQNTNDAETAR